MKIRVSSAYVCFVIGVLLVGALTLIEVPCPIDKGTGVITGAKGLKVTGVEGEFVDFNVIDLGCGGVYYEFTYAVKISLVNEATTPSYGGLVVKFYDPESVFEQLIVNRTGYVHNSVEGLAFLGPPIAGIPIFVEIPAETARTIERIIVFDGFWYEVMTHTISVEIADEIVCPYCGGTGKVPIIEWPRIKANVQ